MYKLFQGVCRFQDDVFPARRELFERLSRGQKPEAVFITCSDSRVDPCLITQTAPGELFVVRNAGNILPQQGTGGGEEGTIEYALEVLGIRDIIVCGHSQCGAMQALLQPRLTADLPSLQGWLGHAEGTRQILEEDTIRQRLAAGDVVAAVEANVLAQLDNLRGYPAVARALREQRVSLHGWVYMLETGEVRVHDPALGRFRPLSDHMKTVETVVAVEVNGSV